jgi:hypothetical protein
LLQFSRPAHKGIVRDPVLTVRAGFFFAAPLPKLSSGRLK